MSKWEDISDFLTIEGKKNLKVGQIMFFDAGEYKIMRKKYGRVWVKKVKTFSPEDADDEIMIENKLDK